MDRDASELEDDLPALQQGPGTHNPTSPTILSDEQPPRIFSPPAHIAARFYRSSTNRRRSSAASSRRNSLSSSHSHQSGHAYRKTVHSNHVAQHLRRASILEDRKARLADRAIHVEQVRLRAALAKAAPRASNSEEKVLAAQQAREKLLARVAASCAEEVNRAKKVAEENKERKAAEERRFRTEMEEKHADVERRRLEYQKARKPRTTSTPSAEGRKSVEALSSALTSEVAARRIQRMWKMSRTRKSIKQLMALDLSIDRVRDLTFMEASVLLADKKVISTTRYMMELLGLDSGKKEDDTFVRRFLSAYMMLGHATDIFNSHGQQEEDLIGKAKELLISYEAILSELSELPESNISTHSTSIQTLSQAYASYLLAFSAWKSRDASVLIGTMVDQFVAFDSIWQTVKDDTAGEVANDYREGIRDNQVLLFSKIKKLAGPERANRLIKTAIRDSRRAKMRHRPKGDVRPRPLEASRDTQSQPSAMAAAEEINDRSSDESSSGNLELSNLSKVFSVVPANRTLVHELLMDPTYRIEISPHSDVRSALNREVCENMRSAIRQGQGDTWTVAVAENIRKRLLKLLKPENSMYQLLSEVLDPEHINSQCRNGLFSYEKFFGFMADLLPRLCAPFRDEEVKALSDRLRTTGDDIDVMIEKLFSLLHIIDLMSLDYTNYMVQQAAPTLIREASGYERRMFAQDLEAGTSSLQRAKRWWHHSSVNVLTESGVNDLSSSATFVRTYARGLVDLAVGSSAISEHDLPETLQLDKERLARIRSDILRFTTVGGILLTAKNLLRRDVRSHWKPEAKRILDCLKDGYDNPDGERSARILAIIESSHGMPQVSHDQLANIIVRFLAESAAGRLCDAVMKLLLQRLRMHIFNRLAASSSADRVRVASTASEGLASIGLSEFIPQVSGIADELTKVAAIDQAAHGDWYRQIAEDLDRMGAAEA